MPLTAKGEKIKAAMDREYGGKKGAAVFYASANSGKIKGVHEGRGARLKEAFRRRRRALRETGSDELRGKNQGAQLRAMMAKDPEGAPSPKTKHLRTKGGKRLGGHYATS